MAVFFYFLAFAFPSTYPKSFFLKDLHAEMTEARLVDFESFQNLIPFIVSTLDKR